MKQRKRMNTTWVVSCAIALAAVSMSAQPVLADEAGTPEVVTSEVSTVQEDSAYTQSGSNASDITENGSVTTQDSEITFSDENRDDSVILTPEGYADDEESGTSGGELVPSDPGTEEGTGGDAGGDLVPVSPDGDEAEVPDESAGQSQSFQYHSDEFDSANIYKVIKQLSTDQAFYSEKSYYDLAKGKNYLTIRLADLMKDTTEGLRLVSSDESIAAIQGSDIVGLLPGTCTIIGYYYDVPILMVDYTVLDEQQAAGMALLDQYDIVFLGNQIRDQYRTEEEKQEYKAWQEDLFDIYECDESGMYEMLFRSLNSAADREQTLKELYNFHANILPAAFSNVFLNTAAHGVSATPFLTLEMGTAVYYDPPFNDDETGDETVIPDTPDYSFVDQTDQDREDQENHANDGSTDAGTSYGTVDVGTYLSDSASGNEIVAVQTTSTASTEGNTTVVPASVAADNNANTTVAESNTTVAVEEKDAILTDEPVAKSAATDTTSGTMSGKVIGSVIIAAVAAFLLWFFGFGRRKKYE